MSPLLVRTGFKQIEEESSIPDGVTLREWARVRHAMKVNPTRTCEQIADAACVTDEIALLCLAGKGATIEEV